MSELIDFLRLTVEWDGSDLHLKAGGPGYVRVAGELREAAHLGHLLPADTAAFAEHVIPESQRDAFAAGREADFAYSVAGLGRFRVAAFRQRGSVGMVLRRVRPGSQTLEELLMPEAVRKLAEEQRGMVLVTGPTGSGKTTTTAAMIGHINATRRCHIVTVEDPIEILHQDNLALVDQREIGVDPCNFPPALRAVARQGTTVILVTHHLEEIIPEIERVVLLRAGRIAGDGPKAEMLASSRLSETRTGASATGPPCRGVLRNPIAPRIRGVPNQMGVVREMRVARRPP